MGKIAGKYESIMRDAVLQRPKQILTSLRSLAGNGYGTIDFLKAWWLNVLTKTDKQEFEQVVHISWERGSIYFDTVKIYTVSPDSIVEPSQAGLAFIPVAEYP